MKTPIIKFYQKYLYYCWAFFISITYSYCLRVVFPHSLDSFPTTRAIAEFIERLFMSYDSSFLFFFFITYLKKEKENENVNSRVSTQLILILDKGYESYRNLLKNGNDSKKLEIEEGIKVMGYICDKINPFDIVMTGNLRNYNWYDLLKDHKKDINIFISKIQPVIPYVEISLMKIIWDLEDCYLFNSLDNKISGLGLDKSKNYDFKGYEKELIQFYGLINSLEKYFDSKYYNISKKKEFDERKFLGLN